MRLATVICPPMAQAEISGVLFCKKTARATTLTYRDGSQATVSTTALEKLGVDWMDWFSIVNTVKHLRDQALA